MTTVLLVDDHHIFREGLNFLLESRTDCKVVGEADSGLEAVKRARELKPDLLILDIAMPDGSGIDCLPRIKEASPGSKIMVLSSHDSRRMVLEALDAGASAYLLKSNAFAELETAIRSVLKGHRFLSPELNDRMVEDLLAGGKAGGGSTSDPLGSLSPRERSVLRLLCEAKTPKTIGAELGISRKTVDIHKRNAMAKLGVDNDIGLIKKAMEAGLIASE